MSLKDELTSGAERVAREAEKAFDKGKTKFNELQIKTQMDAQAKRLGFLVFNFDRGRDVDLNERQSCLDELSRLEDQLVQLSAEAAAKAQAQADGKARTDV